MRVGYCVPVLNDLASFRLRVKIPAEHLGCDYVIGQSGSPTFFFKNGHITLATMLRTGVVYDVVNDHFKGKYGPEYHAMCGIADQITVASEHMAAVVKLHTGRDAVVIDDPYENPEQEPRCYGNGVLWFGHSANIASLFAVAAKIVDYPLVTCTNLPRASVQWSLEAEAACLDGCAVVLMTGSNPGASTNRIVKALRAGRFVVTPGGVESWEQFRDYIWIGDVQAGIDWALANREEACNKILAGQEYSRQRFSPSSIGAQWKALFDLI